MNTETKAKINFKTELLITETYKKFINEDPAIREAECLKVQYPAFFAEIQPGDLFAGRIKNTLVGITPDEWGSTAFGYYCVKDKILQELNDPSLDEALKTKVYDMIKFWDSESTSAKIRASFSDLMKKYLPSDNWMGESGIAFPLYRLTGGNVDWKKLLEFGIPGLIKQTESKIAIEKAEGRNCSFYIGIKIALQVLNDSCLFYADQAMELRYQTKELNKRIQLERIASTLTALTLSSPKNLREAIQLFWIYSLVGDIRNYGRMDVYLGDFLINDLNAGAIAKDEALYLLQSLWQLIADRNTRVHGRVIIGGKGRENEKNADKFALLAMEATRTVYEIEPQLSLRFYKGMNPELMDKALTLIGEGRTYPILYNDDVIIQSIKNAFNLDEQTAEQYVPFGCGEYIINYQSFGTPSGVINLLKALEVTLHNGVDPLTGKISGLQSGKFKDFKSFDELLSAYKNQVEFYVNLMAEHEKLEYKIAGEHSPYLFMSLLYDNCFEKGKGAFSGGIKYLGGTLETYGNTNTGNSLTAVKEMIYEKKIISPDELLSALDSDFEGYENVRHKLMNSPKYGNYDDTADNMLLEIHNHVCNYVRNQAKLVGLHSYLVVIINNSANTLMGHQTSASADGRKSGEPMANGNNPSGGNDKNGVTAFLNSIAKPSPLIHAGSVQNMKFSREMFNTKKPILNALLKTFFEIGGAQAMITVVDKNELGRALIEPEKYSHIFVRVGGFSARFIDLSRDVQLEIISRTIY